MQDSKGKIIEVCERAMDRYRVPVLDPNTGTCYLDYRPTYHACFKGSKVWGCGKSKAEAIGDLVSNNLNVMITGIVYLGKLPR